MKYKVYFFDNKGHYERVKAVPALPFFVLLLLGAFFDSDNSFKTIFLALILLSVLLFAVPFYSNGRVEFRDQCVFFYRNRRLIGRYNFEDINEIVPDFSEVYSTYVFTFRFKNGKELAVYTGQLFFKGKRRIMGELLSFLEKDQELLLKINVEGTVFLKV